MRITYWIKNAALETGIMNLHDGTEQTSTGIFHIKVESGIIVKIVKSGSDDEMKNCSIVDGMNLLMVPAFTEKHCHLDKTLLGDQWQAVVKTNSVLERAAYEKGIIPFIASTTMDFRSRKLIDRLISNGSTTIRSHADIYPEVGIKQFLSVKETLASYGDQIDYETVAFPQHGLLLSNSVSLIEEAMKEGADYVGGVDPSIIDGNMEESLSLTFEIASKYNKGIDYHLHERGPSGLSAIRRIAKLTKEAGLQGKVFISHGFAFRDVYGNERDELILQVKEAGIGIISHVPLNESVPDLPYYFEKGIHVSLGSDNIFDCWSPFGNGDILERLNRYSEMFVRRCEGELRENLNLITGGITPLNNKGEMVWPKKGDKANFILTDASCTAEMIARRSEKRAVFHNGYLLYDNR